MNYTAYAWTTLLLLFCTALGLGGCAGRAARVERPVEPSTYAQTVAAVQNRNTQWNAYRARFYIRAEGDQGAFRAQTVALARLEDRFRLEAFNALGQTVGVLILGPERSTLWVPPTNTVYTARRAERVIDHFMGIPIPLSLFGYSLMAGVPPDQLQGWQLFSQGSEWLGKSSASQEGWNFIWHLQPEPRSLKRVDAQKGDSRYTITYEPAVELSQGRPKQILFTSPDGQMEVTVQHIEPAMGLSDSAFEVALPGTARVVNLDSAP